MYDPNINLKLDKLHLEEGDIVLVKCSDKSIPNSRYSSLLRYIQSSRNVERVLLVPEEITIETVDEENLQHIIDELIKIRDNKWKKKLHKGE